MYARAVEEGAARLRALRQRVEDLGLGAVTIGLAGRNPGLAGARVAARRRDCCWCKGRARCGRRWDLVDRLADKVDAYVIPEVLAYAATHVDGATSHVCQLPPSRLLTSEERVAAVAQDLEALRPSWKTTHSASILPLQSRRCDF